jgi:hypothetical protein
MTANVGSVDRVLRALLGIVLILAPFVSGAAMFQGPLMWVSVIVGAVMLFTAVTRFCLLYRVLGITTCRA